MQTLSSDPCCLFGLMALGVGAIAGLSTVAWRGVRRLWVARGAHREHG